MKMYGECKACLQRSQFKKVERDGGEPEKIEKFKSRVYKLCEDISADYCGPLLMRDINGVYREIFGKDLDYSREKAAFNGSLLALEGELYGRISDSRDPLREAVKLTMASNYIDFAAIPDIDGSAVEYVLQSAERAVPDERALNCFKEKLKTAKTLCYLHDNCGEVVLDKLLIRLIKERYPKIKVTSVVRGKAIINDVTRDDALYVGLDRFAEICENGTDVPGTYLKEINGRTLGLLRGSDIVISKGLGNLETLYGEGVGAFYAFTCKCEHMAKLFSRDLFSAVFVKED